MAGKQLGKLRQWAGEVISVRDKTAVSDEFRDMEVDIELRRRGLWRLYVSSEDYQYYLNKKKECEALEGDEKLLPIEALGSVMIQHGEEFGEDSAFGTSLVSLGKAHCRISTLQESYATTLSETYVASIQRAQDEIKEYQTQRKKLESRRLTLDAATSKLDRLKKSKKEKEKEREEAEDEYQKAKSRFEETSEDVRARMYAIQENEVEQLRELTNFLHHEIHYVEQYLEVLKDARNGWIDEETLVQMETSRTKRPPPRPVSDSRYSSVRSTKSIGRSGAGSDETDNDDDLRIKPSRTKSIGGSSSRAPSRPQSRMSRKRSDSVATAASEKEKDKEKEKEKDKEKDKEKISRRLSVAGWLTGRGNKKEKDKSGSLMADRDDVNSDDEEEGPAIVNRTSSISRLSPTKLKSSLRPSSTPDVSPRLPSRNLKPTPAKKLVVALHDYTSSSSDELSFRAGDQIVVVNEVLDGWWMGLLGGQTGLFPTNYTEVLNSSTSSLVSTPPLPRRPSPTQNVPPSLSRVNNKPPPKWLSATDTGNSVTSDLGDEHPFGDTYIASTRSPLNGSFYPESISSDVEDYDGNDRQMLVRELSEDDKYFSQNAASPPTSNTPSLPSRRPSATSSARKAPPPPPPSRRTTTSVPTTASSSAPPVPSRPGLPRSHTSSQASSASGSYVTVVNTMVPVGNGGEELAFSPFDSPKDSTFAGGCRDFKQNPFKLRGTCNNCFQVHVDRI